MKSAASTALTVSTCLFPCWDWHFEKITFCITISKVLMSKLAHKKIQKITKNQCWYWQLTSTTAFFEVDHWHWLLQFSNHQQLLTSTTALFYSLMVNSRQCCRCCWCPKKLHFLPRPKNIQPYNISNLKRDKNQYCSRSSSWIYIKRSKISGLDLT